MTMDRLIEEMERRAAEAFPETQVHTQQIDKTDDRYTGLPIRREGQTAAAVVNLDELYEEYSNGTPLSALTDKMKAIAEARLPEDLLTRWVKADMLMTAHVRIFDEPGKGLGSTPVTGKLLESWRVPEDALWKAALENNRHLSFNFIFFLS